MPERTRVPLLPVLVLAGLGAAAGCLWETLASPGVLVEGILMAPLLAWAIYQTQTARLRAQVVDRVNQRLSAQMTELWRTEQALRSSEARFEAFMDNSPAVSLIKDEAGRYVYLNKQFAERFGIDRTDWIGKTVHEMLPTEIAETITAGSKQAEGNEESWQTLEHIPTVDDPDCQWLSLRFPFRDSSGARFLGCVAIDFTLQQRAEDRRREAADKLEAVVEASPLAIFSFDCDGLIQSWSLGAQRLFGWSEQEVLGRDFPFIPAEQKEMSKALIARLIRGETFTDVEATRRRRDGATVETTISAAPLRDREGNIIGAMALVGDITARKKNDEMRIRLGEILKATSDFVSMADAQGNVLYHNQSFLNLAGGDAVSVQGKNIRDFHPAWAGEIIQRVGIPTALRDGSWSGETAFITASGAEMPISQVIIAHIDPQGELTGTSTIARDISERIRSEEELRQSYARLEDRVRERTADLEMVNEWLRDEITVRQQAEETLRASEERYRFLADSMPQIVWTTKPGGQISYYNRRWHEYTGLPEMEVPGTVWESVVHADDLPVLQEGWSSASASGQPYTWEYRLKRASDQAYRWHLGRSVPLRDAAGAIIMWVGTGTDIDDFKQAEAALRRLNNELEQRVQERTKALHAEQKFLVALLDNLQEGIVACDAQGALTVFNQATREFHGLPEEPLPPTDWAEHYSLFHADGKTPMEMHDIPLFRAWNGEIVRQDEMVIVPKIGKKRTLLANGKAIRDPEGNVLGAVVAMQDITERKVMDRIQNEFISVVSHELRTPLTSIRGALGLIDGGIAGEVAPQAQTLIKIAYNNTERLVRLVNDILDIEKIEVGEMEFSMHPVPLTPLLVQTLAGMAGYAGQYDVALEMTEVLPEFTVCADTDRLTQVLTNLLSNAVKFSPPGGTVQVSAKAHAGRVRVSVSDHGPGIPVDFQERIFQKFAQADAADTRQRGGTGLGLSICKALVENFGGTIGYDTAPGLGTTFHIDLQEHQS